MTTTLLTADDVAATYPGSLVPAIASVTFSACAGERIAVLGPNGGGKSTLFRWRTGELPVGGGTLALAAPRVALVPQTERWRLDYPVSALDVALMGAVSKASPVAQAGPRRPRGVPRGAGARRPERARAHDVRRPPGLGQRQRVLVARALVQDAPLLLLDEPFAGLDLPSAEQLETVLRDLAREGRGVLMATHDLDQARAADRVLCLNRVQIAFGPPGRALTPAVIERTYGGEIVELGDGPPVLLPAHHHHGAAR